MPDHVKFAGTLSKRCAGGALLGAAMALSATPAWAETPILSRDDTLRHETANTLDERKRELDSTLERRVFLTRDMATTIKERAELNQKLVETARKIQDSEAKLTEIEQRLGALAAQEEVIRDSIAERHASIAKLLAAMQRIGRQPPPAFVTRRDDALKMVRSAMLLAAIFPEFKYQADNLTRELDELVGVTDGIRREQRAQQTQANELNQQRGNIGWLLAQKRTRLASHQRELKQVREAAKRHAKSVTGLEDLLERMDKEIDAARLVAQKRRVEIKPESQKVALLSPGRINPAIPFSQTRGGLPLPVIGRQVRDFASADNFGSAAKGVSIETRPQAQVISPSDGWVVYADEFRSYGQLLIINGGGGYHILLAGMGRIDVSPGQFVLGGEPVAAMGAVTPAGELTEKARAILYVEFRKNGQSIDPGPWWSKGSEKVQG